MAFVRLVLEEDAGKVVADMLADYAARGYRITEGGPVEAGIEVVGYRGAETARVAATVSDAIFLRFGLDIVGLPPIESAPASAPTTWTVRDTAGYTIPAGARVGFRRPDGVIVAFALVDPLVVTAGTTTAAGATVAAVSDGVGGNGLAAGPVQLIDDFAFVLSVASTAATAGGVDAESDAAYRDRLADEMQLRPSRPTLPGDFAVIARRVAGVYRAVGIDGYDPVALTYGNARMVAVAVVDSAGAALSAGVKSDVDALLQSLREVNFVVNVIDPTFTAVNVVFSAAKVSGYDAAAVEVAAEAAVAAFVSPAGWAGGSENPPRWRVGDNTVRFQDVSAVINGVPGLDYWTSLTLNGGTADVTLTGPAPLPSPASTVAGTVT